MDFQQHSRVPARFEEIGMRAGYSDKLKLTTQAMGRSRICTGEACRRGRTMSVVQAGNGAMIK